MSKKLLLNCPRLYLFALIIVMIYFLSTLLDNGNLITLFLSFPALYLIPGLLIIFLTGQKLKVGFLMVTSFFLSTIIAVVAISGCMLLGVNACTRLLGVVYMLLTFILVIPLVALHKPPRVESSRLDYAFLCSSIVAYASLTYFFKSMPRLFLQDETTYITLARHAILNTETYPATILPFRTSIVHLFAGRFFWTLLISSFLCSTGLQAHQAYVISTMFLPMIAIASTLFIPSHLKKDRLIQIAVFILALTNPLLLLFSSYCLNDLALVFFILLAILLFVNSFNRNTQCSININIYSLIQCLLVLIVAILIKPNIAVYFFMYIILVYYIIRYRVYSVSKAWRVLLYALTLPIIIYEFLIDLPYVVSVWFISNEELATLAVRFLILSPIERFLDHFIPIVGNNITVLSLDVYDYLSHLYCMLSPEALSLSIASIGLTLPLTLTLKAFRRNVRMRILICLLTATLWFMYFDLLTTNIYGDIVRYSLFIVPLLIVVSVVTLREVLSNRKMFYSVMLILSAVTLLWIGLTLFIERGGVFVGYGLPKLNRPDFMVLVQLLIYLGVITVYASYNRGALSTISSYRKRIKVIFKFKGKFRKRWSLKDSDIPFLILMISIILNNMYFFAFSLSNSYYLADYDYDLTNIKDFLSDKVSREVLAISNAYYRIRVYVPDILLSSHYLLRPPMTQEEFNHLLKVLPNGTLIILSDDRRLAYKEYANRNGYIFQYYDLEKIPVELKDERIIYDGITLDLRFNIHDNDTIIDYSQYRHRLEVYGDATFIQGVYGEALEFDGSVFVRAVNSSSLSFPRGITVEALVKPNNVQNEYKVILSKGWNYPGGWALLTTPNGKWQFSLKNQVGDCFHVEGGDVIANKWFHLIGVWDGAHLMLYVNGTRYGPVSTTCKIGNDYDVLVGRCQKLSTANYWNGAIDEIRIYSRVLSEEEILEMYYGPKLLVKNQKFRVFQLKSSQKNLETSGKNDNVSIDSVNIRWTTDSTNVRLEIKAKALKNERIIVYLDTDLFLKVLDFNLTLGENIITIDFPRALCNRYRYGYYVANWANIIIVDSQNNLLYHKIHTPFTLKSSNIIWWSILLISLIFLLIFSMIRMEYGWCLDTSNLVDNIQVQNI